MLERIFHELNAAHFGAELPLPKLGWNSRLSSTAGRFCPGSRNFLRPRAPEIEVATYLSDLQDGHIHIRDTLLHEMIHYFLWHRNRPYGHTAEFHQIMKKVGAKRYNTVPKERAHKHWYECPSCHHGFHTKRELSVSACANCCKRHNGGRYHDRFRLLRMDPRSRAAPALVTEPPPLPERRLSPTEIIRRLEQLKDMVHCKG